MFNKYRGQNQIKNQNSPSERHERIEKKQPEPAAVEKEAPEKAKKPVFPSSREKKPAPVATARPGADNDLLRQQEEDEWFRKFKGEAEPVINEEPAPEEPLFDDVTDAENDLPSDDGHDEEITPEAEIEEETLPEEDASYQKESEPEETEEEPELIEPEEPEESEEEPEPVEPEPEIEEPEETPETSEESYSEEVSALEEELAEVEAETGSVSPQGVLEEAIPVKMFEDLEREEEVAEEEPALSPEEDDEKWIQDLLTDIQEKTGTVPDEEETPVPTAAATEYEGSEAGDESDWYQSTPLIRTAALIVLDLTEEDEEYVEETDEDKEAYQSDGVAGEEWPEEPDTDEVLTSIDEVIEDMPEEEVEEVTIDEVDEKLASLMEEEPKEEIDMDAVLDNMDRIIQQTEATPVQFVEETAPAPAPKPRPNPNRNRKKKKKKR